MYRGVVSIDMCYSQGEGLNTSLPRLLYLVLYTVVQLLSDCCPVVHKYARTFVDPTCNASARLVKLYSNYVCDFCIVLFCFASLLLFLGVFLPVIYRRGVRYS